MVNSGYETVEDMYEHMKKGVEVMKVNTNCEVCKKKFPKIKTDSKEIPPNLSIWFEVADFDTGDALNVEVCSFSCLKEWLNKNERNLPDNENSDYIIEFCGSFKHSFLRHI